MTLGSVLQNYTQCDCGKVVVQVGLKNKTAHSLSRGVPLGSVDAKILGLLQIAKTISMAAVTFM